jgi:hypothetical protein
VFITKLQRLLAASDVPFNGSQQAVSAATKLGARFNGSAVSRAMMQAAASIHGVMKEAATAVLNGIEAEFGRDVFSGSYSKLHRVATVVRQVNLVPSQSEAADAFLFCLEAAFMAMKRGCCQPKFLTVDAIDKQRDGSAGWAATAVLKRAVLQHAHNIVRDMAQVDPTTSDHLVNTVLPVFATPMNFLRAFPPRTTCQADAGSAGVSADVDIDGNDDAARLDKLKDGLNKGGVKLVDLL